MSIQNADKYPVFKESLVRRIRRRIINISPPRLIVLSFLMIILLGAFLLMLPISGVNGNWVDPFNALFTAVSCVCVTGITLTDTFCTFSLFGQIVNSILIQLGGLGLITITSGFILLFKGKLGVRHIMLAQQYTSGNITDMYNLIKTILIFAFSVEGLGALLLGIRFVPQFGLYGAWIAIFTSVSSFCNAGISLFGFIEPSASLVMYYNDPLVNLTIAGLIIIGGIGFLVVMDIYSWGLNKIKRIEKHPKLSLNSHIVLVSTFVMLVIGAVLFYVFESNNVLKSMPFQDKFLVSFFNMVSSRTAGFFTAFPEHLLDSTKALMCLFMFIGVGPSSTGGGIKLTTLAVIIYTVVSVLKGNEDTIIAHKKISKQTVYKALTILFMYFIVALVCSLTIIFLEFNKTHSAINIVYDAISCLATCGLSTGVPSSFSYVSNSILMLLMFFGRVGPILLAFSIALKQEAKIKMVVPEGKVVVG